MKVRSLIQTLEREKKGQKKGGLNRSNRKKGEMIYFSQETIKRTQPFTLPTNLGYPYEEGDDHGNISMKKKRTTL